MNMNMTVRGALLCALCLFSSGQTYAYGKADAHAVVSQFYKCLKIIAEEHYTYENPVTLNSSNAQTEAIGLCYDTDINMPNEFHDFGFSDDDSFIFASAYMTRLREFARKNRNVHYSTVKVKEVRALEEIKHRSTESSVNFFAVYVEKTITAGSMHRSYIDSVTVNIESAVRITNVTNSTNTGTNAGNEESIILLRAKAAEFFANGKYDEAYDVYLKIIGKDPMQGDAYYRLALMGFQGKGCKKRFKNSSARNKQSLYYLEQAGKYARTSELRENVRNAKYDITYGFI